MGNARRLKETYPDIKIIGVEPPPGDAIQGLRCLEAYIPPIIDLNLITRRVKVTSQQACYATSQLLKKEGIFAGLSSGAVIHEVINLAGEISKGNIVAILADGGWKYLSLNLWG
jgi:cysteine synthase B